MSVDLSKYKTWLFDCDGVILDSNKIKSDGFYEVALRYGGEAAEKLVEYHKKHGGISRYEKFDVLVRDIIKKSPAPGEIERLANEYGDYCSQKLMICSETPGLRPFLEALPRSANRFVISGGRQDELQVVFQKRNLSQYFDGIYGSPANKDSILAELQVEGKLIEPAIFVGDSKYDYEVAASVNADFVFMSQFTEFEDWDRYFIDKSYIHIENLANLIALQS